MLCSILGTAFGEEDTGPLTCVQTVCTELFSIALKTPGARVLDEPEHVRRRAANFQSGVETLKEQVSVPLQEHSRPFHSTLYYHLLDHGKKEIETFGSLMSICGAT